MMGAYMDRVLAIHQIKFTLSFAVTRQHVYGYQDQRRQDKGEKYHPWKEMETREEARGRCGIQEDREGQQGKVGPQIDTGAGEHHKTKYKCTIEGLRRGPM